MLKKLLKGLNSKEVDEKIEANRELTEYYASLTDLSEDEITSLGMKLLKNQKFINGLKREIGDGITRRALLASGLGAIGIGEILAVLFGSKADALKVKFYQDKVTIDDEFFLPSVLPFSAMAYIDNSKVRSVNWKGKPLTPSGKAGIDDKTVIQKAIDCKGVVHLSKGVFQLTQPIELNVNHNGTVIEGEGKNATILRIANGANNDAIKIEGIDVNNKVNGVTITDLKIDGNRENNSSGNGIRLKYAEECVIINCLIGNCPDAGILLEPCGTKYCENNRLIGLTIYECKYGVEFNAKDNILIFSYLYHNDYDGVLLHSGAGGNTIALNGIYGNYRYGIYIKGDPNVNETWIPRVIGNYIDYNDKEGILLEDNVKKGLFFGNRFYNNSRVASGTYSAIKATSPNGGWCSGNVFEANTFLSGYQAYSIDTSEVPESAKPNIIRSNYMEIKPNLRSNESLPTTLLTLKANGPETFTDIGTDYVSLGDWYRTAITFTHIPYPIRARLIARCKGTEDGTKGLRVFNVTDSNTLAELLWSGTDALERYGLWSDVFGLNGWKTLELQAKASSTTEDLTLGTIYLLIQHQ